MNVSTQVNRITYDNFSKNTIKLSSSLLTILKSLTPANLNIINVLLVLYF